MSCCLQQVLRMLVLSFSSVLASALPHLVMGSAAAV